jgi:hypothetical protein
LFFRRAYVQSAITYKHGRVFIIASLIALVILLPDIFNFVLLLMISVGYVSCALNDGSSAAFIRSLVGLRIHECVSLTELSSVCIMNV